MVDLYGFDKDGYAVVRGLVSKSVVDLSMSALAELIDGGFGGVQYEVDARAVTDKMHRRDLVRKVTHYTEHSPFLKSLSCHPALMAHVECLLGTRARK